MPPLGCLNYRHSFLFVFFVSICCHKCVGSLTAPKELSSEETEFDFAILDPQSPYGSPFGGFGRSTASRLDSLAIRLPNVPESIDGFQPVFFQVRDQYSTTFSCRTYRQDELDPASLVAGVLETPHLRSVEDPGEPESFWSDTIADSSFGLSDHPSSSSSVLPKDLSEKLELLNGICAQFHQGWWSYEWCYKEKITQFHVEVRALPGGEQSALVKDLTSLGVFMERRILPEHPSHDIIKHAGTRRAASNDPDTLQTISYVVDTFKGGDMCEETGKSRESEVVFRCCPATAIAKSRGGILYNGEPFQTNLLAIEDIFESDDSVCKYTMIICTTLACVSNNKAPQDSSDESLLDDLAAFGASEAAKLSILEILDLTFSQTDSECIQFSSGGWWIYELCPQKFIRQFHEKMLIDRVTGNSNREIESQHLLGLYDFADFQHLSRDNEWTHVVNATAPLRPLSTATASASSRHAGNGAFFFQEYKGGDFCDHIDVTDAAIKAGEIGEGRVQRSTTVQYGCGSTVEMTVQEDSTCHYIAQVTIPALCYHPFFQSPLFMKHVVKCTTPSGAPSDIN